MRKVDYLGILLDLQSAQSIMAVIPNIEGLWHMGYHSEYFGGPGIAELRRCWRLWVVGRNSGIHLSKASKLQNWTLD